jgi:hypothetical protein
MKELEKKHKLKCRTIFWECTDVSDKPATSIIRVAAARTQKACGYLQGYRRENLV